MANHGPVALGPSLHRARSIAEQAAVYWGTLVIGGPRLLADAQMAGVLERLSRYGQPRS
jgi:L-fuculose-phosphate aldolase